MAFLSLIPGKLDSFYSLAIAFTRALAASSLARDRILLQRRNIKHIQLYIVKYFTSTYDK